MFGAPAAQSPFGAKPAGLSVSTGGFGGFGSAPAAAPAAASSFGGFGYPSTAAASAAAPYFGSFGSSTTAAAPAAAPSFGSFGSPAPAPNANSGAAAPAAGNAFGTKPSSGGAAAAPAGTAPSFSLSSPPPAAAAPPASASTSSSTGTAAGGAGSTFSLGNFSGGGFGAPAAGFGGLQPAGGGSAAPFGQQAAAAPGQAPQQQAPPPRAPTQPVKYRENWTLKDLPKPSADAGRCASEALTHAHVTDVCDAKFNHDEKLHEESQALAEAHAKHPLVLQRLRDLQDLVRHAQSQHQVAASHATNLLHEVSTAKSTAIGANDQAKASVKAGAAALAHKAPPGGRGGGYNTGWGGRQPYASPSLSSSSGLANSRGVSVPPHLQKLRSDFEKRFEGFEQQVARLQVVAHSQRMGAADPSSHASTHAAALLPASRVLEVVQAQGHQVAVVAEKLARLHARAEALRLRVRERAAAREVVDPFKQADLEERVRREHESRSFLDEDKDANSANSGAAATAPPLAPAAAPANSCFPAQAPAPSFSLGGFGSPAPAAGTTTAPAAAPAGSSTFSLGGFGSPGAANQLQAKPKRTLKAKAPLPMGTAAAGGGFGGFGAPPAQQVGFGGATVINPTG